MPEDDNNLALVIRQIDVSTIASSDEEEAVLSVFEERIAEMLDTEMDLLLSTLYRLDISERKILQVLRGGIESPARGLARLVLERQKEKLATRHKYGGEEVDPFAGQ